ncbi:MAG: NAD(P)/FAD-dependent oxidoreductase [Streptosporangiales bacterium]
MPATIAREPGRPAAAQRVLIVGAGVTGLLTALRCALDGHQVTVLDRGAIPNPESSSFDQHRAIRAVGSGSVAATGRAGAAHRRWLELEALLCGPRSDGGFYRRVGVLTAWPPGELATVAATAREACLPVELVEPGEYPHILFPAGTSGLLELDAGVLLADRVLRAAARWLGRHPAARLCPWRQVTEVDVDAARVILADGTIERGDLVLVAAGPWSPALVDLPVVVHRQTMVYLRPPDDLAGWWESAPSAGRAGTDGRGWLLPPVGGTLLKVSTDAACREVASVADRPDDETPWADLIMAAGILRDAERYTTVAVKRCHYAVDVDTGGARLVRAGPSVWARAASGGDGFRTAPLIADEIAGDLLRAAA